ncbi:hypothetical protein HMPREF1982_03225 [Clostridiales bacterium oral taxon 876 str. F0540]|nr:hypothetical protein HMPREF1982_03225 [Clostridiales bacterium oral taxon 876 str. F0540]
MIWFLIITGILLIVFNIRAVRKQDTSFGKVFSNTEADLTEVDIRIGELRREFSETILELQKEIIKLQKNEIDNKSINDHDDTNEVIMEKEIEEVQISQEVEQNKSLYVDAKEDTIKETENINLKSNSVKIDEINSMLNKGYSVEDIATKLGIGKGEVLLIKELYLK